MLGWGFADFFAKLTIDEVGDIVSLVWAHIFGTLILFLFAIGRLVEYRTGIQIPTDPAVWLGFVFFGVLQAVVYLLLYQGFGKGQVSLLNPVFASFSGLVALVSIVALGEAAGPLKIVAPVVIFGGILLLSTDRSAFRIRFGGVPGFGEVALATLLASVWTLGWDKLVGHKDWVTYALLMYAFMTLSVLAYSQLRRMPLLSVPPQI